MEVNIDERVEKAERLFSQGYNCCQSVVMAYADLFDVDLKLVTSLSAPFGGGMGRLREVCGSVSGASMITGLIFNASDPNDNEAKKSSYAAVQSIAKEFAKENGAIVCRELLGLSPMNPDYSGGASFGKRPCVEYIKSSTRIVGEIINGAVVKK